MNPFKIESEFNKTDFINGNLIRWKVKWFKNRRQIINHSIASLIIFLLGISVSSDVEPTNPFIFLGGFYFVFTMFFLLIRLTSKKQYSNLIMKMAEEYETDKMNCIYEFSNESVKYWDKQKHLDFKWEMFTNYYVFKGYLVLNINNILIESFIFKNDENSKNDSYNDILELVKSKLQLGEL